MPAFLAGLRVQRYEIVIGRLKEQPAAVHTHPAIADVNATLRLPVEVPQLMPRTGIDSPGVIGSREVQNAVHHQRSRLDGRDVRIDWSALDAG